LNSAEVIGLPKSHFIKRKDDNNKIGQSMITISEDFCWLPGFVLMITKYI